MEAEDDFLVNKLSEVQLSSCKPPDNRDFSIGDFTKFGAQALMFLARLLLLPLQVLELIVYSLP